MEKERNQELRKQPRTSVNIECRFKSDENEDKEYGALMLDLSKGGAFLSSTLLPPRIFESDSFVMMIHDDPDTSDKSTPAVENPTPQNT